MSLIGVIDMGIEFSSNSFNNTNSNSNSVSSSILAYFGFNIKRKNNSSILKFSAGYLNNSSKNRNDPSAFLLSIAFAMRAYENVNLILMPSFNFTYGFLFIEETSYTLYNDYLSSSTESYIDNSVNITLSFNYIPKLTKDLRLLLAPSISKDLTNSDDSIILGFSAGLVIAFPGEE